ncbi:MAG TPA: hypothetical protein DEV93_13140 [Chloroflexi bacterium]|nr:hypothetical protein [Chloroflexota bacterium]
MGDLQEAQFRTLVREMVSRGEYPDHQRVRNAIGSRNAGSQLRSGLTTEQTRWRADEVEMAGFDWPASKKARKLVPKAR